MNFLKKEGERNMLGKFLKKKKNHVIEEELVEREAPELEIPKEIFQDAVEKENPFTSKDNQERLNVFIGNNNLECQDEYVYLFKAVRSDLRSIYDCNFKYIVGETVEEEVDPDPDKACASGIHAGTMDYAMKFGELDRKSKTYIKTVDFDEFKGYSEVLVKKLIDYGVEDCQSTSKILKLKVHKSDIFIPNMTDKVRCRRAYVMEVVDFEVEELDLFENSISIEDIVYVSVNSDGKNKKLVKYCVSFKNIYTRELVEYGSFFDDTYQHYYDYSYYCFNDYFIINADAVLDKELIVKSVKERQEMIHKKYIEQKMVKKIEGMSV